jgi:hypothetical protein
MRSNRRIALDALPEPRPEELTKTQAIQRLIAPIRASGRVSMPTGPVRGA